MKMASAKNQSIENVNNKTILVKYIHDVQLK